MLFWKRTAFIRGKIAKKIASNNNISLEVMEAKAFRRIVRTRTEVIAHVTAAQGLCSYSVGQWAFEQELGSI